MCYDTYYNNYDAALLKLIIYKYYDLVQHLFYAIVPQFLLHDNYFL